MKCHHRLDTSVNYGLHYLPQDLYQPYSTGVYITLGKQNQDVPAQICQERTMIPHVLYQ